MLCSRVLPAVLVLFVATSLSFAGEGCGGPAEVGKASGCVSTARDDDPNTMTHLEFKVFEGNCNRPDRGHAEEIRIAGGPAVSWKAYITCVTIEENVVYFGGEIYETNSEWLADHPYIMFVAEDVAAGLDFFWANATGEEDLFEEFCSTQPPVTDPDFNFGQWNVVGGDLIVFQR